MSVGGEQTANGRYFSIGDLSLVAIKVKCIRHALGANLFDRDTNVDQFLKFDRHAVVALSVDARPADLFAVGFTDHAHPNRTQEIVFGLLHVGKEIGEVNDARHVGFAELDPSAKSVNLRHGDYQLSLKRWLTT